MRKQTPVAELHVGYAELHGDIQGIVQTARTEAARSVNALLTVSYWEIGRRIVEAEQKVQRRADYGSALIQRLAADLSMEFGRGFGVVNLSQMRAFYAAWPTEVIFQTLSEKSPSRAGLLPTTWELADGLPNKIMAANYQMLLPEAGLLLQQLEKSRLLLESRCKPSPP